MKRGATAAPKVARHPAGVVVSGGGAGGEEKGAGGVASDCALAETGGVAGATSSGGEADPPGPIFVAILPPLPPLPPREVGE